MVDTLSINGHPHQDEEKDEQQQQQQQDEKIVSQKKIRFSDEVVTVNGESGAEDLEGGMLEQKVSSSDSSPESVHRGEERKDIRRVCKCVERERVCAILCKGSAGKEGSSRELVKPGTKKWEMGNRKWEMRKRK